MKNPFVIVPGRDDTIVFPWEAPPEPCPLCGKPTPFCEMCGIFSGDGTALARFCMECQYLVPQRLAALTERVAALERLLAPDAVVTVTPERKETPP